MIKDLGPMPHAIIEESEDDLIHKRALKTKADRLKSEEDIVILQNRIKLLEAEELRVAKMADEA